MVPDFVFSWDLCVYECVSASVCVSYVFFPLALFSCLFVIVFWFVQVEGVFLLFCFVSLVACFLMRKRKKRCGFGWMGRFGLGRGETVIRTYFMKNEFSTKIKIIERKKTNPL